NTGNNNVISGNTIIGGFKGVHLNGVLTEAGNNQITNNIIRDFYSYGVEVAAENGTLVEGNDISRANRAAITTFYGIYLSTGSKQTVVSKNRIHNTNDANVAGTVYGIYTTASDAPA